MTPRWWVALWGSLYEPRTITALHVVSYGLGILAGAWLLAEPPVPQGWPMSDLAQLAGLILVCAGAVGAPTAWRGWWFLERGAALSAAGGLLLMLLVIVATHRDPLSAYPLAPLTMYGLALGIAQMIVRFLRVMREPYAPGRGPAMPDPVTEIRTILEDTPRDDPADT